MITFNIVVNNIHTEQREHNMFVPRIGEKMWVRGAMGISKMAKVVDIVWPLRTDDTHSVTIFTEH